MKTIVDIVEDISEQFHGIKPVAMVIMGSFNTEETRDFSSYGQERTKVELTSFSKLILIFIFLDCFEMLQWKLSR